VVVGRTVTSLAWFGDDVLAPLLARFSARHKQVSIDLINDPRRFNLSRGEADIALRIGSFHQEYLVERRVGDVSYGLYASADYLDRHGRPDFAKGCAGHLVTSVVESPDKVVHIEWLKAIAPRARTILRTNGVQSQIATAEAGEAMAVLPRVLADRRSVLMRLDPPLPEPSNTVKLGVHPDMRDTPRIRALIDFLVAELKARSRELNPGGGSFSIAIEIVAPVGRSWRRLGQGTGHIRNRMTGMQSRGMGNLHSRCQSLLRCLGGRRDVGGSGLGSSLNAIANELDGAVSKGRQRLARIAARLRT
jgi:LysR substrate binding domain